MLADLLHGTKSKIAQQECNQQREAEGKTQQPDGLLEPGLVYGAQQRGAHANMDRGKKLAIAFERNDHVEDLWAAEYLNQQLSRIVFEQRLVVGAHGHRGVLAAGVGAEQYIGLGVANVDVVDGRRVANRRVKRGLK